MTDTSNGKTAWPLWATDRHWKLFAEQLTRYYTNRTGIAAWTTEYKDTDVAAAYVLPMARVMILRPTLMFPLMRGALRRKHYDRRTEVDLILRGLIAHEAGHVRFSCVKPSEPRLGHLWNILEDGRIERLMARAHEHASVPLQDAFDLMGDHMLLDGLQQCREQGVSPEDCSLVWWSLAWRWAHDHPLFNDRPKSPLWEQVRPLVEAAWVADTSEDVIEIARQILTIIGEEAAPEPEMDVSASGGGSDEREEQPKPQRQPKPKQKDPQAQGDQNGDDQEAESQDGQDGDGQDGDGQDSAELDTEGQEAEGQDGGDQDQENEGTDSQAQSDEGGAEGNDTENGDSEQDGEGQGDEGQDAEGNDTQNGEGQGDAEGDDAQADEPRAPGEQGSAGGSDDAQGDDRAGEAEGDETDGQTGEQTGGGNGTGTPGQDGDDSEDADDADTQQPGNDENGDDLFDDQGDEGDDAPQEPVDAPEQRQQQRPVSVREPSAPAHLNPGDTHTLAPAPNGSPLEALQIESLARSTQQLLQAKTKPGLERATHSRGRFSYDRHYGGLERTFRHRNLPTRHERVHVTFVGDRSGSMNSKWADSTRIQGMHAAASVFTRAAQLDGTVCHTILFDHDVYVITGDTTPLKDSAEIVRTHRDFTPGGMTTLHPALSRALARTVPAREHHLIVIACDGELDSHDQIRVRDLTRRRPKNTQVLPLLIGNDASLDSWRSIFPGAQAVRTPADLVRVTQTIVGGLRRGPWAARPQ